MTEDLYLIQEQLEEECRGESIGRFHKEHENAAKGGAYSESFIGSYLIKNYLVPYTAAIQQWMDEANSGKVGRKSAASKLLDGFPAQTAAFLMLKVIFNKVGYHSFGGNKPVTVTAVALEGGDLIQDEMRLRAFEEEHPKLSQKIHENFNQRELPRYKREEYMQAVFRRMDMPWSVWTKSEKLHVGMALLQIFKDLTDDIEFKTYWGGDNQVMCVVPSESLLEVISKNMDQCESLFSYYYPMVVPPRDWTVDTLDNGGYLTHHVSPYPLVKGSKKRYREKLKRLAAEGKLDTVLNAINAVQRTPWRVNTSVLEALEFAYNNNIPMKKLPLSSPIVPEPPAVNLEGLPEDHPAVKAYKVYRFKIHEENRRMIGKRILASRAFLLAKKFSKYDAIYFPHDMDSRGRCYPKAIILNPQGPDYIKGLLQFAEAKPLGPTGMRWLGIHGANCWGEDKAKMDERYQWALDNADMAIRIAEDPKTNLEWTKADSPVQFLAWCFEWAQVVRMDNPETFLSRLHVDLDATCSGLQHFSAMLRDEVGGFHVNMTRNPDRQDVYLAVAKTATALIEGDLGTQNDGLARAWLGFGMTRSITKRPVMVKPYSGTRMSCGKYVDEAVDEALQDGVALPWDKDEMWTFKSYGADKVWGAIPLVVVAADGAMQWLCQVARLVGKSQPHHKCIRWTTPAGFPVEQAKFNVTTRQIKTMLDGTVFRPRLAEETDELDPRKMASSVPPSFVHSLDGAHLQFTIERAAGEGIDAFAVVHDSFGVHACDAERFARIIRECFVEMYEQHDVLEEFLESAIVDIKEEFRGKVPPVPEKGSLDLRGILENEFFFS